MKCETKATTKTKFLQREYFGTIVATSDTSRHRLVSEAVWLKIESGSLRNLHQFMYELCTYTLFLLKL